MLSRWTSLHRVVARAAAAAAASSQQLVPQCAPCRPPALPVRTLHASTQANDAPPSPTFVTKATALAPGVCAAAVTAGAGFALADKLGMALLAASGLSLEAGAASPISGIPVAIVLGLAARNLLPLPSSLEPGLKACTTTVLRAGIVCIGAKLSALDVAELGMVGVPVVAASITAGLLFVPWFARKMGLPPRMGSLIAAGTSICGVTAITALAPTIKANERETAYAVANVVAFGTVGMLCYPYLAHYALSTSTQIGLFLGTAIHDTSQVMGSALTYNEFYGDEVVLQTAAVTKLTRNLFLAGVIPGLAWHTRKAVAAAEAEDEAAKSAAASTTGVPTTAIDGDSATTSAASAPAAAPAESAFSLDAVRKAIPTFVLGFVAMTVVRSTGDAMLASGSDAFWVLDAAAWKTSTSTLGGTVGSRVLLGTAMAAVGLSTSAAVFRGVGVRPFVVGLAASLVVGLTGLTAATLLAGGLDSASAVTAAESVVEAATSAAESSDVNDS